MPRSYRRNNKKKNFRIVTILLLAAGAIILAWFISWYRTNFFGKASAVKGPGNYPRDVNVLIVKYLDKSDGSYDSFLNQRIAEWKTQIEKASTYHGYKDGSTSTPLLKLNIRPTHVTRYTATPWVGPKPAPDEVRGQVALDSFKAILSANNNEICNIINSENIDQVWYMITPDADLNETSGYNMEWYWSHTYDSDPNMALCGKHHTWISLTLSTERGRENSLHVLGHFMERMISFVQTADMYESRFAGTRWLWGGDPAINPNSKACGDVHFTPNANELDDDYDYYQPESVNGNMCEDWRPNYLDSPNRKTVSSANWKCSATSCLDVDYYNWWFNNMPGKEEEIKFGTKRLPPWFEFLANYDKTLEYYASKPEYYLAPYLEDVARPFYVTDKSISSLDYGSSISWEHQVSGDDRLLVVSVAYANEHRLDTAPGLTSVKYGTTPLTFVRHDSYGGFVTEIWYLKNPPIGKKTILATFPKNNAFGGIVATGTTFVGVDQTNPIRESAGTGSKDTSLPDYGGYELLEVPSQPGDYIYSTLNIYSGQENAVTRQGNTASIWGRVHGDIHSKGGVQQATSTTTSVEWSSSKHWEWAMSGISIKPSNGATPIPSPTPTPTPTASPTPSPSLTPSPTPVPNGLIGRYYDTSAITGTPKLTRTDRTISFNWGTGKPHASITSPDTFSARWTGFIKSPVSGQVTFYVKVNDGARLAIKDGASYRTIINSWTNKTTATEVTGKITLVRNQRYPIRLDYYDNTGAASISLSWSYGSVTKRLIPTAYLFTK